MDSDRLAPQKTKKPTWRNTSRYSATSAYSSTNPPAMPGCISASHPTSIYRNPSDQALQSGYIYILRLSCRLAITRMAVGLNDQSSLLFESSQIVDSRRVLP